MEEYLKTKYSWTDKTLRDIHWPSVKTVRRQLSHTKRMQTCKIMHGWLPVAHMHHHITGVNQCPGCKSTNETINHFSKCTHPTLVVQRTKAIDQFYATGLKQKIPQNILNAITHTLKAYTKGDTDYTQRHYNSNITVALAHQNEIGIDMMARDFLSKHWLYAIHPSRDPQRTMNKIQRMIWMDFVEPLWGHRNDLLHHNLNHLTQAEENKLTESISWYCAHRHTILSHHNQFMADNIDLDSLHTLPLKHKQEWMRHLGTARLAYEKEIKLTQAKQKSILGFMTPRPQ
jgi:hypothetical protein